MNQNMEFVPTEIAAKLADSKTYTIVALFKSENYFSDKTKKIIQAEHLPYLFELREKGDVILSIPLYSDHSLAAFAVYNTTDIDYVRHCCENDPAVQKGLFTYEIMSGRGLKGDKLI